jgi:hypothetical protein
MAIVLLNHESDSLKVHQQVYDELEQVLPKRTFQSYTDTTSHTGLVYHNPVQFYKYISFFKVKPLYTFLADVGYTLGVPLAKAPLFPSVISFIGIAILLLHWLTKILPGQFAVMASMLIIVSSPLVEVVMLSTPDALSALLLLLAFYFILNRLPVAWVILFLTLSILARIDNIIVASLMIIVLCIPAPKEPIQKPLVFVALGTLVIWLLYLYFILDYANQGGGLDEFYGGIEKKMVPMAILKDAIRGLPTLRDSSLSPLLCIALLLLLGKSMQSNFKIDFGYYFVGALLSHIAIKYLLLPDMWDRHYTATILVLIIFILQQIVLLLPFRKESSIK